MKLFVDMFVDTDKTQAKRWQNAGKTLAECRLDDINLL
jgi:hypothetical protein